MIQRLRERLEKHEFLRHVLTLMSGTALAQVLPILASPIISRLYTPAETGVFTVFMAVVGVVVTVSTGRYDLAIVLPGKEEDARALVKLATRFNTTVCVAVGLVLLIFAGPISERMGVPQFKWWLVAMAAISWAFAQASVYNYWCNRHKQYGLLARNKMGQAVTTTGTQLGMGALQFGPAGLLLSTFVGQMWSTANLFFRSRKDIYRQPSSPVRPLMREYRKMPLLNAPTALLDSVRTNGVTILIGRLFDTAAVGHFGQAWKLLQTPAALINSSLSQVFFQKLATVKRGEMLRIVRQSAVRSALVGVIPFTLIYFLSPPLFPIVFGQPWAMSGLLGAALVPWLFLNFITSPISTVFVVTKRQGTLFWYSLPFTAAPLVLIWLYHPSILGTVTALSWLMTALLLGFLALAFWVSWGYDRGVGAGPDDESLEEAEADIEVGEAGDPLIP